MLIGMHVKDDSSASYFESFVSLLQLPIYVLTWINFLVYVLIYVCSSQYLAELLAEHQKLGPFVQVLPLCSRLLNQGQFVPYLCIQGFCCEFSPLIVHSFQVILSCFIWTRPSHNITSVLWLLGLVSHFSVC